LVYFTNLSTDQIMSEIYNAASKEGGLNVNVEKTKSMLLSRHQNAGQNHGIKIANTSFESVASNIWEQQQPIKIRSRRKVRD
jgi:hypothetical protein